MKFLKSSVLAWFSIWSFCSSSQFAQAVTFPEPVCLALNDATQLGSNKYLLGTFSGNDGWMFDRADLKAEAVSDDSLHQIVIFKYMLKSKGVKLVHVQIPSRAIIYPEKT